MIAARRLLPVLVAACALGAMAPSGAAGPAAAAEPASAEVVGWVSRHADRLDTVDPAAPLTDLSPLRRSLGGSTVVGLGESRHGAAEQIALKHRTLRVLVEQLGFRSVAWEEDWTTGLGIDRYLRTGTGDLDALVTGMSDQWRSQEVKGVLRWLRHYNRTHREDVRFVGVDYYYTSAPAYDAVRAYVRRVAPDRLAEARRHLRVVRPFTSDMQAYYDWYVAQDDQARYVRHARRLHALVRDLPHAAGDRAHALATHHARQIRSYYENFSLEGDANFAYRERQAARNLRWWRTFTGDKVAYWAAAAHTANAPGLRAVVPPYPDIRFPSTGSHLRRWYGAGYASMVVTFDRGQVRTGPDATMSMAPAAPDWFEQPFTRVRHDQFVLDLDAAPAPGPVVDWLHGPIATRGFAGGGTDSYLTGGTPAEWYDVVLHRQVVTPTSPL